MKPLTLRLVFLTFIVVSLTLRAQSIRSRDLMVIDFDMTSALVALVSSSGMKLLDNPVQPPRILSKTVYFQRPGCPDASLVMPLGLNYEVLPLLKRAIKPGYRSRFVYLDKSWPDQDRIGMYAEWTKQLVLSQWGNSPYIPVKIAIIVADPPSCTDRDVIDWRRAWHLDRRDAATALPVLVSKASDDGV